MLSFIETVVIYAGMVQGFYAALVLTHTKLRNPANYFLAWLMIILSLSILHSVVVAPYFHGSHDSAFLIREPFIMLVVPFLWFYLKKLNEPMFTFNWKSLLHFFPFPVIMVFSLILVIRHVEIKDNERFYHHSLWLNLTVYMIALCQYALYLVYMLRLIRSFKAKVLNEVSNTEHIDPTWMRIFLVTFLVIFILLIVMMVVAIHRIEAGYLNNVIPFVFALVIYVLGYKGLFQQTIVIDRVEQVTDLLVTKESWIDNQLLDRLLTYMNHHKPYYDAELTLTALAEQLKTSRNSLSEVINSGTGGNFYDFVNKYRVEEVKRLMQNPRYKDYTILAIAFEAGFPSKSTFNSIFKKFTGLTPSEYRNRLL